MDTPDTAPAPSAAGSRIPDELHLTSLTPHFTVAFSCAFWLTVLCLLVALVLEVGLRGAESEVRSACIEMFKVGCGVVFGMVSGKTL